VKPLVSGRDYHSLQRENSVFRFDAHIEGECIGWQPYADRPAILARSNGEYSERREWCRNFYYAQEAERGLDTLEDLAIPGEFHFDLASEEAVLVFAADTADSAGPVRSAFFASSFAQDVFE